MIIAIDGPAAAGKGTLARRLASALNLPYLDTGLLYRAVGRLALDTGADPADPEAAARAAQKPQTRRSRRDDLRDSIASKAASQVASIPAVRAALLEFQRNFGGETGAVLDGRDIGTIIFPNADIKLFVTADLHARAAAPPRRARRQGRSHYAKRRPRRPRRPRRSRPQPPSRPPHPRAGRHPVRHHEHGRGHGLRKSPRDYQGKIKVRLGLRPKPRQGMMPCTPLLPSLIASKRRMGKRSATHLLTLRFTRHCERSEAIQRASRNTRATQPKY